MSKCYTEQMIHAESSATCLSLQYTQDKKKSVNMKGKNTKLDAKHMPS